MDLTKKMVVVYCSLNSRISQKKVYSGDTCIFGHWYLDKPHTQTPALKLEGIGIFLECQYPFFGVRPISPTSDWFYQTGSMIRELEFSQ